MRASLRFIILASALLFWTVSFTFGRTYAAKPEDPYTVRCVR